MDRDFLQVKEETGKQRFKVKTLANLKVSMINLLYLLKDGPKTWTELYQSGVFFSPSHLYKTFNACKRAGLIVKDHREWFEYDVYLGRRRFSDWWVITTLGMKFLNYYDNEEQPWRIERFRGVKQVAIS